MLLQSHGYLTYEADVMKAPTNLSDNWIILRGVDGIVNYYQYWLAKRGIAFTSSSWKPHVSVVRGEKMDRKLFDKWIKNNGNKIIFEYNDDFRVNNEFIWINCFSKELNDLRRFLGLYVKKDDRFHLTLGKINKGVVYIGTEKLLIYDP